MARRNGRSADDQREKMEEHNLHQMNMQRPPGQEGDDPATLAYISEPEDVDSEIDALDWLNSRTTSTANLSEEDVRSKEWVAEYHLLIAKTRYPPSYGLTGPWRAWAFDDADEQLDPLGPDTELELEGFSETSKEAKTRSREGWGVETATRDTKESIVRGKEQDSGGGILDRLRRD